MKRFSYIVFLLSNVGVLSGTACAATLLHELELTVGQDHQTVYVTDQIRFPVPPAQGQLVFELAADAKITFTDVPVQSEQKNGNRFRRYILRWPGGKETWLVRFSIPWPTERRDYLWLDSNRHWYPQFVGRLAQDHPLLHFALTVDMPSGWHAVSQGEPAQHTGPDQDDDGNRVRVRFISRNPQQSIEFVAAPFEVYTRPGQVEAAAYLLQPDRDLADRYLRATGRYIALYEKMLGPYPYHRFSLVENPAQTGYGMPSFTLLGSRVIRLPFVLHTSYPHEILHNWWGNSVYIDPQGGNWSEGLTAYLADHYLKERRGEDARFRRDALQAYRDYVSSDQDFALTIFRGRHDRASQAVGYNKTLMLFHMLRKQLGEEAFFQALRDFYRQKKFQPAGFDDLRESFERSGEQSLGDMFAQWVERIGAPELILGPATRKSVDGGVEIRFELRQRQAGPVYRLAIPVTMRNDDGGTVLKQTVIMDMRRQRFTVTAPDTASSLAVDPEFDIFRLLDQSEVPPSIGALLGGKKWTFVLPRDAPPDRQAEYRAFTRQWGESVSVQWDDEPLPDGTPVWLLGWENKFLDVFVSALKGLPVTLQPRVVTIAGKTLAAGTHSMVIAARRGSTPWLWLAQTAAGDARARRLRHYGKYSYVAFAGGRPVLRGQWPVHGSLLQRRLVEK